MFLRAESIPPNPTGVLSKILPGKKLLDQFIDIFFYNGIISKEIAFGDLLKDGNTFCNRFAQFCQESKERPQLIHFATDGETYGHHKKFGEMALAYALDKGFPLKGFEVINYGAFLKRFPPVCEVEMDEGPKGRGLLGVARMAWGDGKRIVGVAQEEDPDGIRNRENPCEKPLIS